MASQLNERNEAYELQLSTAHGQAKELERTSSELETVKHQLILKEQEYLEKLAVSGNEKQELQDALDAKKSDVEKLQANNEEHVDTIHFLKEEHRNAVEVLETALVGATFSRVLTLRCFWRVA